ncbi:Putative chitin synthase, nucleotide-diphospho-sugar transferase [Colletotrichum destructivum]|uniref:chitin synthase n=1 Tax=Colletotrichum destructivum TaxID=34406 RepID=A0AAX4IS63_9PEZI|nr:Putative chitin synthase, nucleotide-diphospho-sugar transferase [Colletotrichum destructivum]
MDNMNSKEPEVTYSNQSTQPGDNIEAGLCPNYPDPVNPVRVLTTKDIRNQRIVFLGVLALVNISMAIAAVLGQKSKLTLIVILLVKSKDFLSTVVSILGILIQRIRTFCRPPLPVPPLWILSLIPAYSESEEQIVQTIYSLRDNGVDPHRQVMVVILDGKPQDIRGRMTRVIREFEWPYTSLKWKRGLLRVTSGFITDVPVIVIEKTENAGKKDSLILCHDLFNYPRHNVPPYTQLLRRELWESVLPVLTEGTSFRGFDMVFCTDADSTVRRGAITRLAEAVARDESTIAACGLVLVGLEKGYEWSFWNLYQQFQVRSKSLPHLFCPGSGTVEAYPKKYTFGQYVRRRAEGFVGKVTCLPGCITMIAVREEMAGAMRKYAEPVTGNMMLSHQVQYLIITQGTDRRLTYSMLSQGTHLRTLFVPGAVSETLAPQTMRHYLSQRRRWGSNAYFNNFFYLAGENMILATRIAAAVEVVRMSLVYYRVLNTALFIRGLAQGAHILELIGVMVVGQTPSLWFMCSVVLDPELRKRAHKLVIGFLINKCISPFMSIAVFTKVAINLGNQAWGMSGVTPPSAAPGLQSFAPEPPSEPAGDGFAKLPEVEQEYARVLPGSQRPPHE